MCYCNVVTMGTLPVSCAIGVCVSNEHCQLMSHSTVVCLNLPQLILDWACDVTSAGRNTNCTACWLALGIPNEFSNMLVFAMSCSTW